MSERPPNGGTPRSDDDRVRDLLRSLPDPGPMPADVSDRILAALADEHQARAAEPSNANVTALVRNRAQESASSSSTSSSSAGPSAPHSSAPGATASGSSSSLHRNIRRRWLRPLAGIAAAAAVGAVAVVGYQQTQTGKAPTAAVPTATASIHVSDVKDGVFVEKTGTSYTASQLSTQAASLTTSADTHPVTASDVQQLGSVATKDGALSCAQTIGTGLADKPDKVTADIANYEGKPAIIVVITKDGKSTVWALSRTCSKGDKPLAGPTSVAT